MSVTRFCLGKLGNITRWKVKMDEEDTKRNQDNRDLHEEINDTLPHEQLHIPVELELLRHHVHLMHLLEHRDDDESEQ